MRNNVPELSPTHNAYGPRQKTNQDGRNGDFTVTVLPITKVTVGLSSGTLIMDLIVTAQPNLNSTQL